MNSSKITLNVEGMTCSNCAIRIEKNLNKLNGVSALVSFATEKAVIEFNKDAMNENTIIETIEKTGYTASVEKKQQNKGIFQLILKYSIVIAAIPFFFEMIAMIFGIHNFISHQLQFFLAMYIQLIGGYPFYKGAYFAVKSGTGNMDVLVSLGTSSAFLLSAYLYIYTNSHSLYFESSAMVITLVLLGKTLESRIKEKARKSIKKLAGMLPDRVIRIENDLQKEILIQDIVPGDILLVKVGEPIPADGLVQNQTVLIDESMLTGENLPVEKITGMDVFAGTILLSGTLIMQVKLAGTKSKLAGIIKIVEDAITSKPPVQRLADKVSAFFVPTVILISILTVAINYLVLGDISQSILRAVTVLVISCPCALGLATPAAIIAGIGRGSELNLLIRNAEVLEKMEKIQTFFFDKTGTLTTSTPSITEFNALNQFPREDAINLANSLSNQSTHPFSIAISEYAKSVGVKILPILEHKTELGLGIRGLVQDKIALLGSKKYFDKNGYTSGDFLQEKPGSTNVYIGIDGEIAGYFTLEAKIKDTALSLIHSLQKEGIRTIILSGDRQENVDLIKNTLSMDEAVGNLLPEEKLEKIREIKKSGAITAMIGDGINDAPSLAEVDISFSVTAGSGIAIDTADIVLLKDDLTLVYQALKLSNKTMGKIKQNLFFAFFYNIIGIPLAAFGMLHPILAGGAMALSSISVLTNSILLKRWNIIK